MVKWVLTVNYSLTKLARIKHMFPEQLSLYLQSQTAALKAEAASIVQKVLLECINDAKRGLWSFDYILPQDIEAYYYRFNLVLDKPENMPEVPMLELSYRLYRKNSDEQVGVHIFQYHWSDNELIHIDDFFIIWDRKET